MPWIVTGATGFVGEHLTRWLIARGASVVAVGGQNKISLPAVDGDPSGGTSEFLNLDLTNREAVRALIGRVRPAVVVHCAAATDVAYCQAHPDPARRSIVDATRYLTEAVRDLARDGRLVGLSTDLVFDGERAPYTESSAVGPINTYGELKHEAEEPVLAMPNGVVIRLSLVYGPATTHKSSFLGWIVRTLRQGQRLGLFHDEVRTPVFVGDVCRAVTGLVAGRQTGLWHAGGPQRLDRASMGRMVCEAIGGSPGLIEPRPRKESDYAAPRPRDVSLDSSKLWGYLGMEPAGFAAGLKNSRLGGGA